MKQNFIIIAIFSVFTQLGAQAPPVGWVVKKLDAKNSIIEYDSLAEWEGHTHNAMVKIGATAPPNGGLSVQLVILDSTQFKGFPFDAFDGPGGYGETHKVYKITLSSSSESVVFDNYCTAFFEVDPSGGFCFNLFLRGSARARFSSHLQKLMKEKNGTISIELQSPTKINIKVQAPMNGLQAYHEYIH